MKTLTEHLKTKPDSTKSEFKRLKEQEEFEKTNYSKTSESLISSYQ